MFDHLDDRKRQGLSTKGAPKLFGAVAGSLIVCTVLVTAVSAFTTQPALVHACVADSGELYSIDVDRPDDCGPSGRAISWEGQLGPAGASASRQSLLIRLRGETGDEQFHVRVHGETVHEDQASRTWQFVEVPLPGTVRLGDIEIAFVNDRYQPGYDRNLLVDYVEFNGSRYETEADTTYSTGTWSASAPCLPGFTRSQKLNCNGYFQFRVPDPAPPTTAAPTPTEAPPPTTAAPTTTEAPPPDAPSPTTAAPTTTTSTSP